MNILDLIFPKRCIFCLWTGDHICDRCSKKLKPSLPECFNCRRISNYYKTHDDCNIQLVTKNSIHIGVNEFSPTTVTFLWQYNLVARQIMKEAKFNGSYQIFRSLHKPINERLHQMQFPLTKNEKYSIVPIPQHSIRSNERGFSHTKILAEVFSAVLNEMGFSTIINNQVAKKVKNNARQASLHKEKRLENVLDTYEASFLELENISKLILIDDVITTGSTIRSVAKAIHDKNNDVEVHAVGLFRGKASYSV